MIRLWFVGSGCDSSSSVKLLKWCKCLHIVKLTDVDDRKLSTAPTFCGTWTSLRCTQQRLWQSEGVQQDEPICPAGDNISQLPVLNGWMRAGNQNNHQSSPMIWRRWQEVRTRPTGRRCRQYAGRMVGVEEAWDSDRPYRSTRHSPPVGHVAVLTISICKSKILLPRRIWVFKEGFTGFSPLLQEKTKSI